MNPLLDRTKRVYGEVWSGATSSPMSISLRTPWVQSAQLTEWTNRADLMRLKGVSTQMSNLLEECGVDSCKELQHRKADHLHAKLHEINDAKKIAHHVPRKAQIEAWIKEAAHHAANDG